MEPKIYPERNACDMWTIADVIPLTFRRSQASLVLAMPDVSVDEQTNGFGVQYSRKLVTASYLHHRVQVIAEARHGPSRRSDPEVELQ